MSVKYPLLFGVLFMSLILLCGCSAAPAGTMEAAAIPETEEKKVINQNEEILAAAAHNMEFLAGGSSGYLAEIQPDGTLRHLDSGTRKDLRSIAGSKGEIWICGAGGLLLHAGPDLVFEKEETNRTEDLNSIIVFQGTVYAAGNHGTLIRRREKDQWEQVNTGVQGDFIGMECSDQVIMAATQQGEVAFCTAGSQWEMIHYNDYYEKEVVLKGSCFGNRMFWLYGKEKGGRPVVLYSAGADVWSERDLNYLEGADADLSGYEICSMASDGSQMFALCTNGKLLTLPDCTQCNKETDLKEVRKGIVTYYGGNLLAAESGEQMEILDTEAAKQYMVSGETAYEKQKTGAVLIDVRSEEEYLEEHIPGSVLLEVGTVKEKLTGLYPDLGQELIFYCAKGVRSQDALEQALELGYVNVYSLGGIDKWNHELEGGKKE